MPRVPRAHARGFASVVVMTPFPSARTACGRRPLAARWFTAPLIALALLGTGAGSSHAAPSDDTEQSQYVQNEDEPAFTDPSARGDELPPYDARDAQQAVDDMVMDEREDADGQHCPPQRDEDGQVEWDRWGPHRDAAYPATGGDDGSGADSGADSGAGSGSGSADDEPDIVG
ncbi:hypothetical protein ACIOUE_29395 [Streptomyces xanthochromogenes]|uniref:hypothetical protein n=2 Tax=Streptomyces TaxID=1883 RepID=UPI0034236CB4